MGYAHLTAYQFHRVISNLHFSTYSMFVYSIIIGIVLFLGISSILPTLANNQHDTLFSNEAKSVPVTVKEADNKLILISHVIENRLEKAAAILEFTSR
jgi:hypothetical protein